MQEKKQSQIYSNIANAKTSGDLLSALKRAASGPTAKAILQREREAKLKMSDHAIELIAQAMNTHICDQIVKHCKLEADEIRLRDALLKQLAENSYWSLPENKQ
jgi:hypothetical protein